MYLKSNISYMNPVEQVNRKFVPRKTKCSAPVEVGPVETEANKWFGAGTSSLYRAGLGVTKRNFFVCRENARKSVVSTAELDRRALFVDATKGKNHIIKDLSQYSRVQLMWNEARDDRSKTINGISAYGYTWLGWITAVQYAGKKASAQYDVNTFPQNFDA